MSKGVIEVQKQGNDVVHMFNKLNLTIQVYLVSGHAGCFEILQVYCENTREYRDSSKR